MNNLVQNWKTSSTGLVLILTGLVHLGFGIVHWTITEVDFTTTMVSILSGIGLIVAGDGSKSAANHDESIQEIQKLKSAIQTGDTSTIGNNQTTQCPKP